MNRVDRLFAIVLELGDRKVHTAAELSERFALTPRTLYRDIAALKEIGVPVRGEAGTGYLLEPGYIAPTLSLGAEEARVFALGVRYVEAQSKGRTKDVAATLLKKLDLVLDSKARTEVKKWHDLVDLAMPPLSQDLDDPRLHRILDAVHRNMVLEIAYRSWRRDEVEIRKVEPRRLSYAQGIWYMEAWCRSRGDFRTFRIDRCDKTSLTGERFSPREGSAPQSLRDYHVEIETSPENWLWMKETQHWSFVAAETGARVVAHYVCENKDSIASWLLSWGPSIKVRSPQELRDHLHAMLREMLEDFE